MVGWNENQGSIVETKYPNNTDVDRNVIYKYLVVLQELGTSTMIEIIDDQQIALIYGCPVRTGEMEYDFIVAIFTGSGVDAHANDALINRTKLELKLHGDKVLLAPNEERNRRFMDFAHRLVEPKNKKIVFIGYPNSGKSSTKQFIYDKILSNDILATTLIPTKGFETSHYNLLDLQLILFDTSGQEMERWFEDDNVVLQGTDLLIFFFSVENWSKNPDLCMKDLERLINKFSSQKTKKTQIVIFCHKFDLVSGDPDFDIKTLQEFTLQKKIPLFFTSIAKGGNKDLIMGTQLILLRFSSIFQFFTIFIQMVSDKTAIKPLFLLNKDFDVATVFVTDPVVKSEIDELRSGIGKTLVNFSSNFPHKSDYFVFSVKENSQLVVIFDVSVLHSSLSYIVMECANFDELNEINKYFLRIKNEFRWQSHKIQ